MSNAKAVLYALFANLVKAETAKWAGLAKASGAQLDN